MAKIDAKRMDEWYDRYTSLVIKEELGDAFDDMHEKLNGFLQSLAEGEWDYRYAPGKWSIKEMVQHIIDTERVFCYRALSFARNDSTELPGFDQDSWAAASDADRRTGMDLMNELKAVQESTRQLFIHFSPAQLEASGRANNRNLYGKGIAFSIIGHSLHHLKVLREKYVRQTSEYPR